MTVPVIIVFAIAVCWAAMFMPSKRPLESDRRRAVVSVDNEILVCGVILLAALTPLVRCGVLLLPWSPWGVALALGLEAGVCLAMVATRQRFRELASLKWELGILKGSIRDGVC